ncbi:hypothetical protein MKW92_037471 [Papaver armeniacum]|nr:hypothetical protein MKW92_037471 [Papaver armeniacum]
MTESIKIIQQALEGIPGGPYENLEARRFDKARDPDWNDFDYRFISKKTSPTFELIGDFSIGDHSAFPWRWKIGPPVKRMKLADIMTILGSIDIIMGEVDR